MQRSDNANADDGRMEHLPNQCGICGWLWVECQTKNFKWKLTFGLGSFQQKEKARKNRCLTPGVGLNDSTACAKLMMLFAFVNLFD